MNLFECIILGISSLRRNLLRSSLTILGIIVGVGFCSKYGFGWGWIGCIGVTRD